jgi:hypothetical protein
MKKSNGLVLWFTLAFPVLLIFVFLSRYFIGAHYEQPQTIRMGNSIINAVKSFRDNHHRLPMNLKEVGVDGKDLLIFTYKKIDNINFELMYELSLGDVSIYHSNTDTWEYK